LVSEMLHVLPRSGSEGRTLPARPLSPFLGWPT
jgi:hypothetical protein